MSGRAHSSSNSSGSSGSSDDGISSRAHSSGSSSSDDTDKRPRWLCRMTGEGGGELEADKVVRRTVMP
jgi:hypothetical protein